MKAKLLAFLALILIAASARRAAVASAQPESLPLSWAASLSSALPRVTDGRAGQIVRSLDDRQTAALKLSREDLAALADRGITDLEGLNAALRGAQAPAAAVSKTLTPVRLKNLSQSLAVLSPVIARLKTRGLAPEGFAKSPSRVKTLARALTDEAADSGARAAAVLSRSASQEMDPARTVANFREIETLIESRYPFLDDAAMDRLLKAASPLREKAEQAEQSLAAAGTQANRL